MGTIWNLLLIGIILRGGDLSDIFLSKTLKYSGDTEQPITRGGLRTDLICNFASHFTTTVSILVP